MHDYLTQRGGAERVLLSMMRAFPQAQLVTSVYEPSTTFSEFADYDVRTTWLSKLAPVRRDPRVALPLLAPVFSGCALPPADVVLCSSSGWAHGIRTDLPKIVYCHNPPRWLYQSSDYLAGQSLSVRLTVEVMRKKLTDWDRDAAETAVTYLANSTTVQERIMRCYELEAELLPPPIAIDPNGPREAIPGLAPGFLLSVSRPRSYKNATLLAEAVSQVPGRRFVQVGGLPARPGGGEWPAWMVGVRDISDQQLNWLYANCTGLLAVSHEDFGLTPLEANAFGKPAACLQAGGYLDTLDPGVSGVFVDRLSVPGIVGGIRALTETRFDPAAIRRHATRYSERLFTSRLRSVVAHTLATARRPVNRTADLREPALHAVPDPRRSWPRQHSVELRSTPEPLHRL